MKTIWKFELETTDYQAIDVPAGFQFLKLDTQYSKPVFWALVNSENPKVRLEIRIVGTGHPASIGNTYSYLGSYQLEGGALVFHAFGKPGEPL